MLLSSHEAKGRVQDSGGLTIARNGVAEHFRNSKDGVEQSWSFEQKPSGTGDLEVRLPVKSGRYLGETVNGLHFAAGSSGLGVRYGHGTWVDSEGQRTPVPARFEADSIVLRVPAQVVDASTYPAVLDPIVSPEIGMDDPVNGPADNSQYNPAIAHNGTSFLVVWHDYRNSGSYDIYGARVSNTGTVLDTTGIRISNAINWQYAPAVTHDGTNFLVVWHDSRGGNYDIYGSRVSNTGTVLDLGGIPISTAINEQSNPSVSHDGTNFLVVWQDYRSSTNYDIYGARVSGTGTVLDISGIPISTATNNQSVPAVASNGTNSLVVWQDTRGGGSADIYGARVSNTGTVLNTSGILISNAVNTQESPALAYNGTEFIVVWQDYRSGTNYDIYGSRVSGTTGVVRNPSGIPIFTATSDQQLPAVAREGTNFLVVWQDYRSHDIYGARLNSTGTVLDTGGILISTSSTSAYNPAVAHDGTNFLVVWHDHSHINSPNIYGARVSSTGSVLDASNISISRSSNGQYTPSVAHDGTNFLVVWQDFRGGNSAIYGARVDETGTVVHDTSGIPIATGGNKYRPVVTHGGTDFLVVWYEYHDNADIYGARVSSDGTVLDTSGIPISTAINAQSSPVVAHDGANFLVAWQDYRSGNADIYGARVSSDGTVLDTSGIPISTATNSQYSPVLAFNQNFLVVWQDYRSGGNADIYGARVSSNGTLLDTSGILISSTANSKEHPSVAHNGTNFLVVWTEYRSSTYQDIYGARVTSAGTLLDTSGISISAATNSQHNPVVAHDGANFLVVWQDYRSGTGFSDIYGARVNELGKVLDTSGIAISTEPEAEVEPTVTAMGGEYSLVVYRRSNPSPSTNSERVMARLISP
ncbi:hypothetical protein ACN28I_01400 [Archangium gephyra]|uniref:hypothetical protein n=1 Tax=Archangium gephyra TaxID=48 RepID=UPI003B771FC6